MHPEPIISAAELAVLLDQFAPTDEQRSVVEAGPNPALVIAGAGSGKTTTMAFRVVWLIANNRAQPDEILGLTFTRKAAAELEERIIAMLDIFYAKAAADATRFAHFDFEAGPGFPVVSTYNAYAAQLVNDYGLGLGFEPDPIVPGEAVRFQLAAGVLDSVPAASLLALGKQPTTIVSRMLALADGCAEHLVPPERLSEFAREFRTVTGRLPGKILKDGTIKGRGPTNNDFRTRFGYVDEYAVYAELIEEFRRVKRERGIMDFGDQVEAAATIAKQHPLARELERQRWKVVLLDEYQDTSYSQFEFLSRLFGGGHSVTAVGDPRQAIYGWRGASEGNIADFDGGFGAPNHPVSHFSLNTSWRNDLDILTVANAISEPLSANDPRLAANNLVPKPGAAQGDVALVMHDIDDQHSGTRAEEWSELIDWLEPHYRGSGASNDTKSCAILCRVRSTMEPIAKLLRKRGIAVQVVGTSGLLDTPEITDIVAVLHVLEDPGAGDWLMRLVSRGMVGLGASDLATLYDVARGDAKSRSQSTDPADATSLIETIADLARHSSEPERTKWRRLSPTGLRRLSWLGQTLNRLRSTGHTTLVDLIRDVERAFLIDIDLMAASSAKPNYGRRNVEAFLDSAAEYQDRLAEVIGDGELSLTGFLAWLETANEAERGLSKPVDTTDPSAVTIMTINAAKGLEFDVVAIPSMVTDVLPAKPRDTWGWLASGVFPYPLRGDRDYLPPLDWKGYASAADLQSAISEEFRELVRQHHIVEERRLAYVAVTRARHHLWASGSWWNETNTNPREISPFLSEAFDALDRTGPDLAAAPKKGDANPAIGTVEYPAWPAARAPENNWLEAAGRIAKANRLFREGYPALATGTGSSGDTANSGERDWASPAVRAALEQSAHPLAATAKRLLQERTEARTAAIRVSVPQRVSATSIVSMTKDPESYRKWLARPIPVRPSREAALGTAVHAWIESRYSKAALIDHDELGELGGVTGARHYDAERLEKLKESFLASPFANRTPVTVEQAFELTIGSFIVPGSIDAVFRGADGGFEIVDWKSGRTPSEAVLESMRYQLAVYRLAWRQIIGEPGDDSRIRAGFYFLGDGNHVTFDDLPSAAEIQSSLSSGSGPVAFSLPSAWDPVTVSSGSAPGWAGESIVSGTR